MPIYNKKNKIFGNLFPFYTLTIACLIIFMGSPLSYAHGNQKYQSILSKRIMFYPLYYNTLQLTHEQASEFEYIIEKYNREYQNYLNDKNKLKELSKQEDKELKQILDKRQKTQFAIIKHLERQDIRRSFKEKNYYKSNPRMSIFGDLPEK